MTDAELVRAALTGDQDARGELVGRWSTLVLAFCHARVGNRHVAEDLAQETLLRGIRKLDTLSSPEKFGSWLRGIATRVCLDWRKSKQSSQVPFSAYAPKHQPDNLLVSNEKASEHAVEQAEDLQHLMSEVEALPEEYREVLMLYYYQDVTYVDLAEMLDVSKATVNARLTKARAILRQRLTRARS